MELTLYATVIGKGDILSRFEDTCSIFEINSINMVNQATLGNFKTFNYELLIDENKLFYVRRDLMNKLAEDIGIMAMYCHGDPMSIYIFRRFDKSSREKHVL